MVTSKQICKTIKTATGYDVVLKKGNNYFWFESDSDETDPIFTKLHSTSVYTPSLNDKSIDEWVRDFKNIIKKR